MSDLSNANTLDIFERDGVRWQVIGLVRQPCVLLRRADLPPLPINERTDLAVIPESEWAKEWRKEPA